MTDQPSDRDDRTTLSEPPADGHPEPRAEPVIVVRELPRRDDLAAPAEPKVPIESSLVGEGSMPAAEPRLATPADDDWTPEPLPADDTDLDVKSDEPPPVIAAAAASPVAQPQRRRGFVPTFLGGVAAAGIGAGAMYLALPHLRPDAAAIQTAATEAAKAEVDGRIAALTEAASNAGAEAARQAIAAAPAAAPDSAALDQQGARITALEQQLASLPQAPTGSGQQPAADLQSLRAELQAQSARLEELAGRSLDPAVADDLRKLAGDAQASKQAIDAAAAAVDQKIAAAGQQADALTRKVDDATRRIGDTAALAALESALAKGSDGTTLPAQLQAVGVAPPEALSQPIPPLADLQRDFPQAARAGLRAALQSDGASAGTGGGLANFLRVQTGARSVTPRAGNDPDAILSRAGDAVGKGDIATALTEIGALPAPAQAAMEGWTGPARAWAAGQQALGTLKTNP